MSVVAEYTLDPLSYATVMRDVPGMGLTVEQIAACNPDTVSITFWARGDDFDAFEDALGRTEVITNVEVMGEQTDQGRLYQIRLPAEETTYWEWAGLGGVLLGCTGTHDGLAMRMRLPDREAVIAYRKHCIEQDISFSLTGLHSTEAPAKTTHQLTQPQQELLAAAIEQGYFTVPRTTRLDSLADRFGISDQAASERMRRGLSNVLENETLDHSPSQPVAPER